LSAPARRSESVSLGAETLSVFAKPSMALAAGSGAVLAAAQEGAPPQAGSAAFAIGASARSIAIPAVARAIGFAGRLPPRPVPSVTPTPPSLRAFAIQAAAVPGSPRALRPCRAHLLWDGRD
jgi:hypothetical protein